MSGVRTPEPTAGWAKYEGNPVMGGQYFPSNWQRHPANPIIRPGENQWDHDACYKPYAIIDGEKWLLWYNGRHGTLEQIGVAFYPGEDLGF